MTDCKHDGIATYRLLDGTPAGMWGCTQCARKFVPVDHEAARKKPTMTIDGVEYFEAPEPGVYPIHMAARACVACDLYMTDGCSKAYIGAADNAFGGDCQERRVIYVRAKNNSVSDRLQQFGGM